MCGAELWRVDASWDRLVRRKPREDGGMWEGTRGGGRAARCGDFGDGAFFCGRSEVELIRRRRSIRLQDSLHRFRNMEAPWRC